MRITILALLLLAGCSSSDNNESTPAPQPQPEPAGLSAKLLPTDNKILSIIGQDLGSVRDYNATELFPVAGGVTTYFNLFTVRDPDRLFGGIGLDNDHKPFAGEADWWGSGPYNAYTMANENPHSALAIGLEITEQFALNGLSRLIAGEFDAEIDKLAALLNQIQNPTYLRIGYEFDGTWNAGYTNAENYQNAWRRIVDRLRAAGVTNAAYVWQSSASPADDAIEGRTEDLALWYPGDEYVDWIGYSWFLTPDEHGTNPAAPSTQKSLTDQVLAFARARNKPVMCAEASPQGYFIEKKLNANIGSVIDGPSGENAVPKTAQEIWDEWYVPFFDYVHANADIIRAVAYINMYWDIHPKWGPPYKEGLWGDSRVQADPYITDQWLNQQRNQRWLHGGPDLAGQLED